MTTLLVLRGLTGEMRGREFPLTQPAHLMVGRSRSCELRLAADGTVSRHHCLIELDDLGAWVQDLGSLNGTYVNGEKIGSRPKTQVEDDPTLVQPPRHVLEDGDELRVCNNVFAVCLSNAVVQEKPIECSSGQWQLALGV
jgi:pSer/pThr/pTyr-binding forkhead associated (FHA) protein